METGEIRVVFLLRRTDEASTWAAAVSRFWETRIRTEGREGAHPSVFSGECTAVDLLSVVLALSGIGAFLFVFAVMCSAIADPIGCHNVALFQ